MTKEKTTLKVTVLADEIVVGDKTHKQGDEITLNLKDPVSEGLLLGGSVVETAEHKKRLADEEAGREESDRITEAATKSTIGKGVEDGSR